MVAHPGPGTEFARERQRDLRTGFLPGASSRLRSVGDFVMTRDRAIYEPARLSEAEADFSRRYPGFDPDGAHAELRRREYARLDESGQVYLDYTGGGLYAASQVEAHAELLRGRVLGNPHSNSPASLASTELVEEARRAVREFFNAPPEDYLSPQYTPRRVLPVHVRWHVRADRGQPQLGQRDPGVRPAQGRRGRLCAGDGAGAAH